jgi:uncharacterized protein YdaU (DUF1376 family)
MNATAFQFYADDFLAGTFDMSTEEVGAYVRLLCHQWNRGSIPVEPSRQQRLAGGSVSDLVLSKFKSSKDGLLRNERMEEERQKQDAYRELQRKKGILSGKSRRTAVEPLFESGCHSVRTQSNSPSPSPSPYLTNKQTGFPTLEEVKTNAAFIGQGMEDAELFWHHFESSGWIDKNGHPVINWKSKQQTWRTQTSASKSNPTQSNGAVNGATVVMMNQEYIRVCNRLTKIRDNAAQDAMGQRMYSDSEQTELNSLKKRRSEIKTKLGIKF